MHNIQIKEGQYQELYDILRPICGQTIKSGWHFFGQRGCIFISFDKEEDQCIFILKYGEYIA